MNNSPMNPRFVTRSLTPTSSLVLFVFKKGSTSNIRSPSFLCYLYHHPFNTSYHILLLTISLFISSYFPSNDHLLFLNVKIYFTSLFQSDSSQQVNFFTFWVSFTSSFGTPTDSPFNKSVSLFGQENHLRTSIPSYLPTYSRRLSIRGPEERNPDRGVKGPRYSFGAAFRAVLRLPAARGRGMSEFTSGWALWDCIRVRVA